jgi:hypothetical protein
MARRVAALLVVVALTGACHHGGPSSEARSARLRADIRGADAVVLADPTGERQEFIPSPQTLSTARVDQVLRGAVHGQFFHLFQTGVANRKSSLRGTDPLVHSRATYLLVLRKTASGAPGIEAYTTVDGAVYVRDGDTYKLLSSAPLPRRIPASDVTALVAAG